MKQTTVGSVLFFGVALLSMIVALLPLLRGDRVNAVFLSVTVVFFILGIAFKLKAVDRS